MDDSLFEDKKFNQQEFDDSLFDDSPAPMETLTEAPDMGRLEAAVTSFGQGSSLGTAPIVSGIVGAGANAIGQVGDALGLTTDAELEKQGFTMPDKKTGLEGLMEAYYDSRDRQKGAQQEAHDTYPVQSIAMNIAGSIPTTIASGGATGAASKILPRADVFNKATGVGTKVLAGAREGAKAGALVGLGEGDAKLAEGEIGDTLKEVAGSTVGGAAIGGLIPAAVGAVKGIGGMVSSLPISKQIATAYKGGKAGINLDENSAYDAIKTNSEQLLQKIQQKFREAGLSKADALDFADEVGLRVDAGEAIEDVIEDLSKRRTLFKGTTQEKNEILNLFKELTEGPSNPLQNKQDIARAKTQQKMEAKGYQLLDEVDDRANVQDILPTSNADKNLALTKQTYQKINEEAGDVVSDKAVGSKPVEKIIQQINDNSINPDTVDINNLSLRDVRDVLNEINYHTGDLNSGAKSLKEEKMRSLAMRIKDLRDEALEQAGGDSSGNASMHKTFLGLERAGIEGNVLSNRTKDQREMVDSLRRITTGDKIDRDRMFEYLNEASPEGYRGFKDATEFLNEFNDLSKNVKPLNSTNAMGLLGSARNIGITAANKAGGMTKSLRDLTEAAPQKLEQIAQRMGMSPSKDAQQYATVLMKALQGDQKQRSATLFGLYQQPAFRELYQNLGEDIVEEVTPVGTDENNN